MKRIYLLTFLLCLFGQGFANNTYIDGISYKLHYDNLTAEVEGVYTDNYPSSISILESVTDGGKEYSVTSIGARAFYRRTGLTSITIPNSVTSIGDLAFCDCTDLTSLTIPNSVTSIGDYAFWGCSGLTSLTIPNSVTSIGRYAFLSCSGLTSLTIPNSVTSIGEGAFELCTGLTSLTISNSVTSIGDYAFWSCSGLTTLTIPNSVISIGYDAFYNCSGLTSIIVEEGNPVYDSRESCNAIIRTSANELIAGCNTTVIPDGVTSIGDRAFYRCTGLTSLTIPNSVTSIGYRAFEDCYGLTSITIPNSVTSIGGYAFSGCSGLTKVQMQATTPPTTRSDAFSGCSALTTIYVPTGCAEAYNRTPWNEYTVADGVDITVSVDGIYYILDLLNETAEVTSKPSGKYSGSISIPESVTYKRKEYSVTSIGISAFRGCSGLTSLTIPNSVTSIGNSAFRGCSGLTSFNIPNSVTSIGNDAFVDCTGLTSLTIPNSVTSIGIWAFSGCSGLTSLTIPNSVTSIGDGVFCGCSSLTSLTIPNSVTSIAGSAFKDCTGLTSVTIPNSVTSIGSDAFYGCTGLTSIIVEEGNPVYDSRESCNAIIRTSTNSLIIGFKTTVIPDGVTSIAGSAFKDCTGLTSLTIPNSVTSIGNYAFRGCSGLTSLTIPCSVRSIGVYAFSGCSGLTSLTILEGVTSIKQSAFEGCSGLTSLTIPNSVTSIGEWAFNGCTGLTSLTIPNSVTSIGYYAFAGCTGLTSLTIPNSVTSIGESAFSGCTGLTSLTIPNSVTSIGSDAFYNCSGLTSIIVEEGNPVYDSRESCNAIIKTSANKLITGCNTTVIPDGVTSIGGNAFRGCTGLTSINIPNSVTSIENWAFYGCSGLTSLTMNPATPPSLGYYGVFNGCTNLSTIYVPNEDILLVYNAVAPWKNYTIVVKAASTYVDGIYYSLNGDTHSAEVTSHPALYTGSLTIPATITYKGLTYEVNSIAMDAFERCSDLTELTLSTATPPAAAPTIFIDCMSLTTIHIPDGSLKAYNCAPWSDFTLVDAGRERLIQLVADVNNYVSGTSKAAVIPTAEVTRQANELLDEARADVESLTYDVNTVGRLQQLRDYLATGQFAGAEDVDVTFQREATHTGWQSLYVPFDIAYDDIADDFVVAELNNFHQYDDNNDGTYDRTELEVLHLKSGDIIAHHTPYVIRAKETGTHTISLTGATLYASANNTLDCSSTKIHYVFQGTYQGVSGADMQAGGYYAMSNGELCKANSVNANLSAFRWYLSMEDRSGRLSKLPARIRIVSADDDATTDIDEVEVKATDENAPVYDLNGRLVGRKDQMHHLPKGVYVMGGKKIIR